MLAADGNFFFFWSAYLAGFRSTASRIYEAEDVRDLIFLSREGRDLGVAFQAPPGSQASSRGLGLTLGLGRSLGGGNGNPLQYFCLENPHEQRSLAGYSPWGRKESDLTG